MINYEECLNVEPYSMDKNEKKDFLTKNLKELTIYHFNNCPEYRKIMNSIDAGPQNIESYYDIPYIPVRLFKEYILKSIKDEDIQKVMTSSGTSGQTVSQIYLDKKTVVNQTKILTKIVSSYIGKNRLPMIILDTSSVLKNRKKFSARGAGILGFSIFGRDKFYAFDENMQLDIEGMKAFLNKHRGERIFLFGFTFIIWEYFYKELKKMQYFPDLSLGILIHGGGWKQLESQAVSAKEFKDNLREICKIESVYNYYGMAEQTGTIYMECECGYLHTSVFSDVIIRKMQDFSIADYGEEGLVEVVSILPASYPGHILLTEDRGIIVGEDNCLCGRKGKYFKILGRIKNAELRGCSDTYAAKF